MSSIYVDTVSPASLHDLRDYTKDPMQHPQHHFGNHHNHTGPVTPAESHLLSPYSSHLRSNSASPTGNFNTPTDTVSTADYYQPSEDFSSSEFADDPFFGASFDDIDVPDFVGEPESTEQSVVDLTPAVRDDGVPYTSYPISPHKTPSLPTTSFFGASNKGTPSDLHGSVLTRDPSAQAQAQPRPPTKSIDSNQSAPQLTPDTRGGSWSSDDSLAPAAHAMAARSPRVTVSMWNKDEDGPVQGIERSFTTGAETPRTVRAPHSTAGDLACSAYQSTLDSLAMVSRDVHGSWVPNSGTGHRGLAPGDRPSGEVPSLNQQTSQRERQEKNKEVFAWVSRSASDPNQPPATGSGGSSSRLAGPQLNDDDNIPAGEVPLGDATENRHVPGQAYIHADGPGGPMTQTDFEIMRHLRNWGDGPAIHAIQTGTPYQPETSQAAIEKFHRQCQDNESIVSHAATWGTRRRSMPSVVDVEGVISGNFLKKLSISHSHRPSFMKKIPSLVRKPSASQLRKRKGSNASEVLHEDIDDQGDRRGSKDSLAPPSRTSSWGLSGMNKKPTPSLNTALFEMTTGAAAIGTTHARSGSVSASSMTSPKTPFALSLPPVKSALRRPRSKTELPKTSNPEGLSNLVGMLKKQGGPPVAQLARSQPAVDPEDDDEDDDEGFDDMDMKTEQGESEAIVPTFGGFREHVLRLNPRLACSEGAESHHYLVDRIAHQMIIRYKQLLNAKIKHLNQVNQRNCPCGTSCMALGGSAMPLDSRGIDRGFDPLSARPDSSDGDTTPLEGGINAEMFPSGIPIPPTPSLPAEFECQLCYSSKKFQKPSDWTKHVHEDVQPFTCTWDKCRDPKMFKRKADWVRHENEGHRHLEWWTCDVDDCHHTCYRRDNFLQHLVREHKFTEPKVKTKAAIKKAGGGDRTWQKVEQCHIETSSKPSDEACRFCGKTFPTWKKLTVHLAKHMEHISLPVLKLVAAKDLDADTIISPVQDPPPRSFGNLPSTPVIKQDPHQMYSPPGPHSTVDSSIMDYHNSPHSNIGYPTIPQMQNTYYAGHQPAQQSYGMAPNREPTMMMPQHFNTQPQYQSLPVTTASPYPPAASTYAMNMQVQDTEPFPAFPKSLGIEDPTGGMGYDNMLNPAMQPVRQYGSNPGSVSPYSHSPHHGHAGTFYNP
ncbi:Uu.00g019770.m01.CDS01 [Anthostomella pinea]|uniref:Uu.00g019770.m01.CDS01 n=1 Tax=Anthostomella pinea TaxID=933095 RepID=A0AAI8W0K1_9PEZI|nr:Uu.00g019770.m01.CDS01 [Anthostomella pinea]